MRTLIRPACPARGAITDPTRMNRLSRPTRNSSRFPSARLYAGVLFRLFRLIYAACATQIHELHSKCRYENSPVSQCHRMHRVPFAPAVARKKLLKCPSSTTPPVFRRGR
jgi:hypothetical protein